MTDFSLPSGFSNSKPASSIRDTAPHPRPARNRLATTALWCVVLFFIALVAAIALHPNIPGILLIALAALPVAAIVLGIASRRNAQSPGRRTAHIAVKVGIVLGVLVLGASILLPSMCRPREAALVAKCHSQLANIYASIETYKAAHEGNYPPNLDALITDPAVNMPASVLICPASNDSVAVGNTPADIIHELHSETFHQSYEYIPPTPQTLAGDGVIVYEHLENHRHAHLHVMFRSGEIRMLTRKEADALVPALAKVRDTWNQ